MDVEIDIVEGCTVRVDTERIAWGFTAGDIHTGKLDDFVLSEIFDIRVRITQAFSKYFNCVLAQ